MKKVKNFFVENDEESKSIKDTVLDKVDNKFFTIAASIATLGLYPVLLFAGGQAWIYHEKRKIKKLQDTRTQQEKFIDYQNTKFEKNSFSSLEKEPRFQTIFEINLFFKWFFQTTTWCLLNVLSLGTIKLYTMKSRKTFNSIEAENFNLFNQRKADKEKLIKTRSKHKSEIKKLEKLNSTLDQVDEFNFENTIRNHLSTSEKSHQLKNDPFVWFLFWFSHFLVGVMTGGLFFIYMAYHRISYKKNYNLFNNFLSHDVINTSDFNGRIHSLTNNFENNYLYSDILLSDKKNNALTNYDSLFKSIFFKHKLYKFLSISFLTLITMGLFPIGIMAMWAFKQKNNYLMDIKPKQWKPISIEDSHWLLKKLKFKLKPVFDFGFDIKLASLLSSVKIMKVTTNISLLPTDKDFGVLFIQIITSPIFKWLFTLFLLLIVYTLGAVWYMHFFLIFLNPVFISFVIFFILFTLAISYHIFLLF